MNQSNQTKVKLTYALTFLSGLLLGWLAIGWWLWPVEYVDEVSYHHIAQNQASEIDLTWLMWLAASMPVIGGVVVGVRLIQHNRVVKPIQAATNFDRAFISHRTETYIPVKPVPSQALAHARLTFGPTQPTDQHFPIESQQEGEPSPGEFGVNQVDDQSAWDVWLFDRNALVTVTKVLADQADGELASRGEIISWDNSFGLNTPNLRMTGTAHKVGDRMIVELTVEGKEE